MHFSRFKSVASGNEAEKLFLFGYNGTGAEVASGTPVCWDVVASDGRTFKLPTATGFNNQDMFAGIVDETVGTACYTARLLRYGPVNARCYGVASTFIPGANLILVVDQSYLAYGTEGEFALQGARVTALQTCATADTYTRKVFVQF